MPRIFISYRREDSIAYAGRIYDRLSSEFGAPHVFMDIDTLEPGVDFVAALQQTVISCDTVLAIIGRQWLTAKDDDGRSRLSNPNDFVSLEIGAALQSQNIRVVPVLVGNATMPRSTELPEQLSALSRRNAVELPDIGFHQALGRLIQSIKRIEQDRLSREDAERQEREKAETARLTAAKAEQERLAQEEAERQKREKAEAAEKAKQERQRRQAATQAERWRIKQQAAAKADQERIEREKAEAAEKEEQERQRREAAAQAERRRIKQQAAAKADQERIEREKAEAAEKEKQERQRREAAAQAERKRIEQQATPKAVQEWLDEREGIPAAWESEQERHQPESSVGRIMGVFAAPKKTFADIAARPSWFAPMILLIMSYIAFMYCVASHVGWEHAILQSHSSMQQMDPSQREAILQQRVEFAPIGAYVVAPIGIVLRVLFTAGVLFWICKKMGASLRFDQMLGIISHAMLPGLIYNVLAIIAVFVKNPEKFNFAYPVLTNLGAFMEPPPNSGKFVFSLAVSVDLFAFWALLLSAVGITAGARKFTFSKALVAVVAPWVCFVLAASALSAAL